MIVRAALFAPGFAPLQRRSRSRVQAPGSDERLEAAFAAHASWAFEAAYSRYGALLYSTAYNVLGNAEDAKDCVHDALTRVWRVGTAYARARGALRSFLTVCVRNEAISRARAQGRRSRLFERLAAEPVEHDELHVVDTLERDRVRAALATLPADQRVPLELAYYGGKTHTEISRELNAPLGTVKSRIAIGLRKLGSLLEADRP